MYAITGATGHIGSKAAEILLDRGENVRVIGRDAAGLRKLVKQGAEAVVGDLKDTTFLTGAFSGANAVFIVIPPDYTADDFRGYQNDAGRSIVNSIIKGGVKYVQFPYDEAAKGMQAMGISLDASRLFIDMSRALNEGLFAVNRPRTIENTTPTSIEEFADVFAEAFEAASMKKAAQPVSR